MRQGYSTKFIGWSQHVLRVPNLLDIPDLIERISISLTGNNI